MSANESELNNLRIERDAPATSGASNISAIGSAVLVIAVLIGGASFAAYSLRERPVEVEVIPAASAPSAQVASPPVASAVLTASGYVVARRQATISAKVTGRIAAVLVEEGSSVREGEVLARLDDQSSRAAYVVAERQLAAARAAFNEARIRKEEADRNLDRTQRLQDARLISEADLDAARSEALALGARVETAKSEIEVAASTVKTRLQELADLEVRAPFTGVVVSQDAQPGEIVSPMSAGGFTRTGIATIVDMSTLEIEVDVNESFITHVRAGQQAEAVLDAYPEWTITSHVINIVPMADRQKATVRVRIGFDTFDARILPDMGVKVNFLREAAPAAKTATSLRALEDTTKVTL
jgi:RND family efflux transporter MFP subunit